MSTVIWPTVSYAVQRSALNNNIPTVDGLKHVKQPKPEAHDIERDPGRKSFPTSK